MDGMREYLDTKIMISEGRAIKMDRLFQLHQYKMALIIEPSLKSYSRDLFSLIIVLLFGAGIFLILWSCIGIYIPIFSSEIPLILKKILEDINIYTLTLNTHVVFFLGMIIHGFILLRLSFVLSKEFFSRNYSIYLVDREEDRALFYETADKLEAMKILEAIQYQIAKQVIDQEETQRPINSH